MEAMGRQHLNANYPDMDLGRLRIHVERQAAFKAQRVLAMGPRIPTVLGARSPISSSEEEREEERKRARQDRFGDGRGCNSWPGRTSESASAATPMGSAPSPKAFALPKWKPGHKRRRAGTAPILPMQDTQESGEDEISDSQTVKVEPIGWSEEESVPQSLWDLVIPARVVISDEEESEYGLRGSALVPIEDTSSGEDEVSEEDPVAEMVQEECVDKFKFLNGFTTDEDFIWAYNSFTEVFQAGGRVVANTWLNLKQRREPNMLAAQAMRKEQRAQFKQATAESVKRRQEKQLLAQEWKPRKKRTAMPKVTTSANEAVLDL